MTCLKYQYFELFLNLGNFREYQAKTQALCQAKTQGEILLLNRLLGAEINIANSSGRTPLHIAICTGAGAAGGGSRVDMVKALLDGGADPNRADNSGQTPLHCAAGLGLLDIVSMLLEAGAKPNVVDKAGLLPINLASKHKRTDVVDLLFSARASKNRKQKKDKKK